MGNSSKNVFNLFLQKFGSGHIGRYCCQWSDLIWKSIQEAHKGLKITQSFLNATQTKIEPEILQLQDYQNIRFLI